MTDGAHCAGLAGHLMATNCTGLSIEARTVGGRLEARHVAKSKYKPKMAFVPAWVLFTSQSTAFYSKFNMRFPNLLT